MRNPWRFLLLRSSSAQSATHISMAPSQLQVKPHLLLQSLRTFSSTLHSPAPSGLLSELSRSPGIFSSRTFSSEPIPEPIDSDHLPFVEIFCKSLSDEDIRNRLESSKIEISHDLLLKVLGNLKSNPDVASRVFDWVSRHQGERLSSKAYNLMLGVLGVNGLVNEFWDLVGCMRKKGYGVSKSVYDKVFEKFEKDGLVSDMERLQGLYSSGSTDNSVEKVSVRIGKMIRQEVWGDDVEERLRAMNVAFTGDMVKLVLDNLAMEPTKALIFFRWIDEGGLFRHDEQTFNAMARVLGREDCIDRFWKVVNEMRRAGYEMESATYIKVLDRFTKRKLMNEAVDLYEFAMAGANMPSVQDCTFLLRKLAVSKEFDMNLFSRVVKAFVEGGNVLKNSLLKTVLKSLTSVGRFGEGNDVLKVMQEGGYVASTTLQRRVAFWLGRSGRKDAAVEFANTMEASGGNIDYKTWTSFIQGYCVEGDLDKASDCFLQMLEQGGVPFSGYAFELLVTAYCHERRALDAYKILCDQVSEKELKPWHGTYKLLIHKLLVQGSLSEALNLLSLMKSHGFPPYVDPFIEYVSKFGTGNDAISFLKTMTVKIFPSTSVVLRVFEAFFKAGRHMEAQDFLSKCPAYIRNHADVLNLFCSKSREGASTTNIVA